MDTPGNAVGILFALIAFNMLAVGALFLRVILTPSRRELKEIKNEIEKMIGDRFEILDKGYKLDRQLESHPHPMASAPPEKKP
jgi:hypothetical protein